MNLLVVSGISKQEKDFHLQEISFSQDTFQKIAIAGETGSGKSSLLKIIAGLLQPDTGEVLFENERVKGPHEELIPGHPGIAYLSQYFELRANYRVEEVLNYANKRSEEEAQILFKICRIDHLLKRKTDQLSGGEKQRIALARLLVSAPRLLLLDEPFSNLDIIHKNILKSVIRDLGEELQITCILVSHDPLDTLSWADKILVMKEGKIIQEGKPEEVYNQPVNAYTAALFGSYNLLNAEQVKMLGGNPLFSIKGMQFLLRPEHLILTDTINNGLKLTVKEVHFYGPYCELELFFGEITILVRTSSATQLKANDCIQIAISPDFILPI